MRLAFWFYQAAAWSAVLLGWPFLLPRVFRDPRYRSRWGERLGGWGELPPPAPGGCVWLHGASLGEIRAASPLIAALRQEGAQLLITTTSPSGRAAAGELAGPEGAARLLPLDLAPFVARAFRAARPAALVIVETELWPALLHAARSRGVPALLVNGRISDRTFPRYLKLRRWLGPLLNVFSAIQAQSSADAERFEALGAPAERLSVGGNLKFDLPPPDSADPAVRALRRSRAGGWRLLVGGSTHRGDERALLQTRRARTEGGLRARLLLAPRHLERLSEVEAEVRESGYVPRRWSELREPLEESILETFSAGGVLVADVYGLLARFYGAAEVAFVGGSLAPVGGHNLLEPLLWGAPVLFGPHTANAREIRDAVLALGLGQEVCSADELTAAAERFLSDAGLASEVRERAKKFFQANRGAVGRAMGALAALGTAGVRP
ncbi:MAG: 3-deoxy-D-manno-octulosonic acid transferase [Deltaproteobacteria bacterium]|nr:3-deoxy-D-manno-octulosonic acid transferase [Deltaproteobacteria bacterium]